ncbi:MAG: transglutaminase family protein [Alphaproteobacteria bacterium]|nr:transglutaminase family protein [Alphaproteobacteria bacterium]
MFYSIRHVKRFRYSAPVRESAMALYMQPRTEARQRLQAFQVQILPHAQLFAYSDYLGNAVYHFDVPGAHDTLTITAESAVEMADPEPLPDALPAAAWDTLRDGAARGDHWDMLHDSHYIRSSEMLSDFENSLNLHRDTDPLTGLKELNTALFSHFDYVPDATHVDSQITDALKDGKGVCQDFAHIMIALVRNKGIPCRYVSGYVYRTMDSDDRSIEGASHAWIEAYLPDLGWVGFDPTNNVIAAERHIRVAVGRDYADVPPTRGAFKGGAASELAVAVTVLPTEAPAHHEDFLRIVRPMPPAPQQELEPFQQQEQQQQQ